MASGIRAGVCVPGIGANGVNVAVETAASSMTIEVRRDCGEDFGVANFTNNQNRLENREVCTPPSKKGKKAKKKEEWTLEYFILLHSKHLVHFQPNTGFVDPFKKTISGKAIDLMQASVAMDDEPTEGSSELQAFRIKTSRIEYHLKPQDEVGGNAEDWVEEITEVMLAAEEGDDDDADRDYGAFMGDYNEVVPANEASRRPP